MTKAINDGYLPQNVGRVVELDGLAVKSDGPSTDHVTLCRKLAARYRIPVDEVLSYANRYYWRYNNGDLEVCPVRVIDERNFKPARMAILKAF
jgi:hypothetical protein